MPTTDLPDDAAAVVQRQLEAYNARDLERLLASYAADAALFEHPDTLLARGKEALRARFALRLAEPNLHAALLHRTVCGDTVVDHESVTRTFPEGPGTLELVMIYEVRAGRIARVQRATEARDDHRPRMKRRRARPHAMRPPAPACGWVAHHRAACLVLAPLRPCLVGGFRV